MANLGVFGSIIDFIGVKSPSYDIPSSVIEIDTLAPILLNIQMISKLQNLLHRLKITLRSSSIWMILLIGVSKLMLPPYCC